MSPASFTLPPSTELANELQQPMYLILKTSSTVIPVFFIWKWNNSEANWSKMATILVLDPWYVKKCIYVRMNQAIFYTLDLEYASLHLRTESRGEPKWRCNAVETITLVSRHVCTYQRTLLYSQYNYHTWITSDNKDLIATGSRGYEGDRQSVKLSLCPVRPRGSELDLIDPWAPPRKWSVSNSDSYCVEAVGHRDVGQ